jgi:ABC-type uncharacterized transport system YnjBCD substrate-binding protein
MLKFLPALALLVATSVATAAESWETLVAKAQGQTVYWNAWAGY